VVESDLPLLPQAASSNAGTKSRHKRLIGRMVLWSEILVVLAQKIPPLFPLNSCAPSRPLPLLEADASEAMLYTCEPQAVNGD
jgi:hypothetical protein